MKLDVWRLLYPLKSLSCKFIAYDRIFTSYRCSNTLSRFSSCFVATRTPAVSCRGYCTSVLFAGQSCRHTHAAKLGNGPCRLHSTWTESLFNSCASKSFLGQAERCSGRRYKHRSGKRGKNVQEKGENLEDEDDDYENEDEDSDDDLSRLTFAEDKGFPDNYKEIKVLVKSLRLDALVSEGLNIARNKVDDYFLESKLKLNGERVIKKSKQVKIGDYIDLVTSNEDGIQKVKRVRVLKLDDEKTSTDKLKVTIRAWRSPVSISA